MKKLFDVKVVEGNKVMPEVWLMDMEEWKAKEVAEGLKKVVKEGFKVLVAETKNDGGNHWH